MCVCMFSGAQKELWFNPNFKKRVGPMWVAAKLGVFGGHVHSVPRSELGCSLSELLHFKLFGFGQLSHALKTDSGIDEG